MKLSTMLGSLMLAAPLTSAAHPGHLVGAAQFQSAGMLPFLVLGLFSILAVLAFRYLGKSAKR